MNLIVAYDIAHPRRLQKVAKILSGYGVRVQKSVFECDLSERQLRRLRRELEAVIDPIDDGIKYFPLCKRCACVDFEFGPEAASLPDDEWIVV
jgi:CRISPR-associated protein Cas2